MAAIEWLTHADFADRVGETFDLRVPDGADEQALPLELVETIVGTQPAGAGPNGEERQQFSVVFRGAADAPLEQSTYELTHEAMGDLVLFLVPIGPDGVGLRYEAAFA